MYAEDAAVERNRREEGEGFAEARGRAHVRWGGVEEAGEDTHFHFLFRNL